MHTQFSLLVLVEWIVKPSCTSIALSARAVVQTCIHVLLCGCIRTERGWKGTSKCILSFKQPCSSLPQVLRELMLLGVTALFHLKVQIRFKDGQCSSLQPLVVILGQNSFLALPLVCHLPILSLELMLEVALITTFISSFRLAARFHSS